MKTLKIWIWVIASIMIILVLLYFIQFNGKLSNDKTDWGTFGDYLSGVFAMFNLAVVVFLAAYVSKLDKDRSERELEVQRKILITQHRFTEINKLEDVFDGLINMKNLSTITDFQHTITTSNNQITNFRHGKLHLFPKLRESEYDDRITDILSFFDKYAEPEFYTKLPIDLVSYRDEWFKKIPKKDELLALLYNFTTKELKG